MGGLFDSGSEAVQTPYEQNPWEPQQPFLLRGFREAESALNGSLSGIPGNFTAGLTDEQRQALAAQFGFGMNTAQEASGTAMNAAQGFLNTGQSGFDAMGAVAQRAGENRTGEILNNAAQFANDPNLQGQIDAALGDVRNAFDMERAGINSAAASTGNMGSSRTGAMDALALDDAQDRAAAISSTMRGNAYQAGIDRSIAMDQSNLGTQLAAASGQAGASGLGMSGLAQALGMGSSGIADALSAGSFQQAQNQNEINGSIQRNQAEMDLVRQYMAAVGGNYGGSGYGTQVMQSSSPFQQIMGGASMLAGIF